MKLNSITLQTHKNKLPAEVLKYKSEVQKLNWIMQMITDSSRKVVIIDQKRSFLDEQLKPVLEKDTPRREINLVTAFSNERYDPFARLTLGSPSMATGISIDQPIELLIICFNDVIATPESYEQMLARLRNDNEINKDARIFILVTDKKLKRITRFIDVHDGEVGYMKTVLNKINVYLTSGAPNRLSSKDVDLIEKAGSFMPVHFGQHEYDPTYFQITCQDAAEHSFTRQVGTINFLRYFKQNPDILSGVRIVGIRQMPEMGKEEEKRISEMLQVSKDELIERIKIIPPTRNYEEEEKLIAELKEDNTQSEEREQKWIVCIYKKK